MSRSLRPQTGCIRKGIHQHTRSICSTFPRLFPGTAEAKEDEELTALSGSFLSTRSEIDAYLRAQNDKYLANLKQHLKNIYQCAESINTALPELSRRAAYIQPPKSDIQSQRNTIPPYTVSVWRKSVETIPPITKAFLAQVDRVVKNIEDLEGEPYRADVTASAREKMNKQLAEWTHHEKEMAFTNANLTTTGLQVRFNRGVEQLENNLTAMVAAREEKAAEKEAANRETMPGAAVSLKSGAKSSTASSLDGPATSYRPLSAPAAPLVSNKSAGWGASPTKVGERGKHVIRAGNPLKSAAAAPLSNAEEELETLRQNLEADAETAASPTQEYTPMIKVNAKAVGPDVAGAPKVAESNIEIKAMAEKAEPKVRRLADLQRLMDASQKGKD